MKMNYYKQQLGKITLASILLASPILMALPATEVQAAATTTSGKAVEKLIDALPSVDELTFENDGQAVMEMQTAYLAMTYSDKGKLVNQEKYKEIVNLFTAEFEGAYKNPDYSEGDLYYFTSSFMHTQKLITNMKQMKPFDEIVFSDRANINTLYTSLNATRPYYEQYVQPTTSYTEDDIDAAYKKVTMLNYVDLLQKKLNDLPAVDLLTIDHSAKFKLAQTAYNNLMTASFLELEEPAKVIGIYNEYAEKYAEIETTSYAKQIMDEIKRFDTVENVTAEDTDVLNLLVTNYGKLLIPSVIEKIDGELLLKMRNRSGQLLADEVEAAIKSIGNIDELGLKDEDLLTRIDSNYLKIITANAKGFVVSYDLFLNMKTRMAQLKTAKSIDEQIAKLPTIEGITLADYTLITQIRQKVIALDDVVVQNMANYAKFNALETAVITLKQQEILSDTNIKINNITAATLKADVIKLLGNFDLLTSENAVKVEEQLKLAEKITAIAAAETDMKTSLAFYNAAEKFMKQLSSENTSFEQFSNWTHYVEKINAYKQSVISIAKIEGDINQLPTVAGADSKDIPRINKVYEEYNALPSTTKDAVASEYKLKIIDLHTLVLTLEAKNKLSVVTELIGKLPQRITLEHIDQVEAATSEYNKLEESEKPFVTNIEKLQDAQAEIKELHERAVTNLNEALLNLTVDKVDVTDRSKIANLKTDYYKLTVERQSQILHFDKINLAEQKIDDLYAAVAKFEIVINNLNPQESIESVKQARIKFNSLTSGQQNLVRNLDTLELYEFFIAEGMTSTDAALNQKLENMANTQSAGLASSVYSLIEKLPEENKLTLAHILSVMQARESYNQLTAINQSKVNNMAKLVKAENKIEDLKKEVLVKTVLIDELIDKLPEKITMDDDKEISSIRQKIDNLDAVEQIFLTKYDRFIEMEAQLTSLELTGKNAAKKVTLLISALPVSTELTLSYEKVIEEITQKYNQLTATQKKQVINYAKLTQSIHQMEALELNEESAIAGDTVVNKKAVLVVPSIKNTTKSFSGKTTAKAKVTVYVGKKKLASTTASATGNYTLKIAQQKKSTKLKFVVTLNGQTIKTTEIAVTRAKVQAATALKATTTKITGKALKNAKVKVYAGATLLKTVKVNRDGVFSATIPAQKHKSKLKVVVIDKVNNQSTTKTVTVK